MNAGSQNIKNSFDSWRWQLANPIRTSDDLKRFMAPEVADKWLDKNFSFASLPFAVTPYFASLMNGQSDCPIFFQVVSSKQELAPADYELKDPLGEEPRLKVPHLVHRYPDRVLFLATDRCASYCRFCTRKRWVGQGPSPQKDQHEAAFRYIEQHPSIKEIIFSGGDPLVLSNERLDELFSRAFSIPHIDVVRIHSRMLSFAPMRVDNGLLAVFKKYSPLYLVTHFNHPKELTSTSLASLQSLHACGVSLLNQSVLLRGVNDCPKVLTTLFRTLVKHHTKPYYLHQCDVVEGAQHFRVPLARSLEIMQSLRGHISGLLMPTFVIDIPNGHGKVPLVPNPVEGEDAKYVYLKGFKGEVAAYPKC
ncbi:MAG: KamA family radical SAM protein [Myxococcales bacterium]|nr:KamA family radical SAM protein [Myxococcales bacterium]USN51545.1 MAG: KamA family radical SAM protein [Myxococcales bacterium]